MAHVVKDLKYLAAGVAPGGVATNVSDTGQGGFPNVQRHDSYVLYRSSATSTVVLPYSQVVEIVETLVP